MTFALCHEVCEKKKFGRRPTEQCVGDFCSVPRGAEKKEKIGRGPIVWGDGCHVVH